MLQLPASGYRLRQGFTIVELMVSISIILLLVAIVGDTAAGYQERARDSERIADAGVIAKSLERNYRTQAAAIGATYPSAATSPGAMATIVDSIESTIAPSASSNSIVMATNNAAQSPTLSQYIYQPLNLDGSLCTSLPCVRFKLYYRLEVTNTVEVINSVRQQ